MVMRVTLELTSGAESESESQKWPGHVHGVLAGAVLGHISSWPTAGGAGVCAGREPYEDPHTALAAAAIAAAWLTHRSLATGQDSTAHQLQQLSRYHGPLV